ncbi:MAG: alginate lyase family protein [Planctomycetota bacterium]
MDALLTFRTVRHLWLSQLKWRLKYRRLRQREEQPGYDLAGRLHGRTSGLALDPTFPRPEIAAMRPEGTSSWHEGALTLLNEMRGFAGGDDWGLGRQQAKDRLWMATLHGHRWLLDLGADEQHRFLRDWIAVCRPGTPGFANFAWNSYDIATRLLCWACLPPDVLDASALESFAAQAEYLDDHVEWDLRANHLLRDAAGLACAGRFLKGPAAERWLQAATAVADSQVDEQVLPDGGHFERSPMYHIHVMEDLLRLWFLVRDEATRSKIQRAIGQMAEWIAWMRHPDGRFPQFNDGGFNGACDATGIIAVAVVSGTVSPAKRHGGRRFRDTGLVAWQGDPWTVFFDVGPIGPDYQPGHAHADTLSLEASFAGHRLFIDPGSFSYDNDARRRYDRSTAAHNTVCIDDRDSSEVWHIFRVGRRAYPLDVRADFSADGLFASAAHDGYSTLPGRPKHSRTVTVTGDRILKVTDLVEGQGSHALNGGWLLAPGWQAEAAPGGWRLSMEGARVSVHVNAPAGMALTAEKRACHPEYGLEIETTRLCWNLAASRLPAQIVTVVE